jgi:hypothetical protein
MELTKDFLRFKVFVNTKVLSWIDKFSCKFPDLHIWKKTQGKFLRLSEDAEEEKKSGSDKFEDKYN